MRRLGLPTLQEEEKAQAVRRLSIILPILTLVAAILAPLFAVVEMRSGTLIAAASVTYFLGLFFLVRRGRVQIARLLLVLLLLVIVTASAYKSGGVNSGMVAGYFVLMAIAAWSLGSNATVLAALLSIASLWWLFYVGRSSLAIDNKSSEAATRAVIASMAIGATAIALRQAMQQLNHALERARSQERAVAEKNRELEAGLAERRQAEEALRESEARFRDLFQTMAQGVVYQDASGSIISANPAAERLLGLTLDQMCGRTSVDPRWKAVHEDGSDFPGEDHPAMVALRTGKPAHEVVMGVFNPQNQEYRWILVSAIPEFRPGETTPHRVYTTFADITERHQAQEALSREVETNAALAELLSTLLSPAPLEDISYLVLEEAKRLTGSPHGYVGYIDPPTGHLVATTAAHDIWDACQVAGKTAVFAAFSGLWGWVLDHREPLLTNAAEDDPRSAETPPDHIPVHRFLSAPAMIGDRLVGQLALANADHDYGERDLELAKRLANKYAIALQRHWSEQALQQQTVELQARNEELDAFAHTVAHDLRAPLGLVVGLAETLEEVHDSLSAEKLRGYLGSIARNGRKMDSIVGELLLLAGLRQEEVAMQPLEMGRIVAEAQERLAQMAEGYQAAMVGPAAWPVAVGHGPWVEQVWFNYLSNAIKYGGRSPQIELGYSIVGLQEGQGKMARFWVKDNGPGISPEDQGRLFRPFTKLDGTSVEGYGLGLSIVRRIVDRMGGQVGVESTGMPGEGSLFYFELPLEPVKH